MNSLGGLRPDTVIANITGDLRHFWKVLNEEGHVLNWNGQVRLACTHDFNLISSFILVFLCACVLLMLHPTFYIEISSCPPIGSLLGRIS